MFTISLTFRSFNLIEEACRCSRRSALHASLGTQRVQEVTCLGRLELDERRELDAQYLLEIVDDVETTERRREVDVPRRTVRPFRVVLDLVASGYFANHLCVTVSMR